MPKITYWSTSVTIANPFGLLPGETFALGYAGFTDGDAIQVTAHPGGAGHVRGDNTNSPLQPRLTVENLQVDWAPPSPGAGSKASGTRSIFLDVKNVGTSYVTDFLVAISMINK
ncbi:MAG: hypothetical protein WCD43_16890 [Candidatus Acidiferrales bacterium]